jgi:poly-gamma-glutamate synthesis protein (capsule biosynthesis protein)
LAVFRVLAVKGEINIARLNATNLNEVDLSEIESMSETMRKDSDIISLNLHWGLDYELTPAKNQIKIARKLCDKGVDILIGNHPHVLQPIELYQNNRGSKSLIIYSLGNWRTAMRKNVAEYVHHLSYI